MTSTTIDENHNVNNVQTSNNYIFLDEFELLVPIPPMNFYDNMSLCEEDSSFYNYIRQADNMQKR